MFTFHVINATEIGVAYSAHAVALEDASDVGKGVAFFDLSSHTFDNRVDLVKEKGNADEET